MSNDRKTCWSIGILSAGNSQLCDLWQVSRSWYYEKQAKPPAEEAEVDLRETIERIET